MIETETPVLVGDKQVATIEVRPNFYMVKWPTQLPDEEVFESLRDFYHRTRTDIGDNYRTVRKIFPIGVALFQEVGRGVAIPDLEVFLDAKQLLREVAQEQAATMRVNTPFTDMLYDLQRNPTEPRRIYVASHINLSSPLGELVAETHSDKGFYTQSLAIAAALQEHVGKYQ